MSIHDLSSDNIDPEHRMRLTAGVMQVVEIFEGATVQTSIEVLTSSVVSVALNVDDPILYLNMFKEALIQTITHSSSLIAAKALKNEAG